MNKQRFNNVVSNPENISSDDKANLKNLAKNYPYSQIIHSLVAKAYASEKNPEYKKLVGTAAMYATDRQILKDLVTAVKQRAEQKATVDTKELKKPESTTPSEESKESSEAEPIKKKQVKVEIDTSSFYEDAEMLRNAIWSDLESLKLSKEHYLDSHDHSIDKEKEKAKSAPKKRSKSTSATADKKSKSAKKPVDKKASTKKIVKTEAKEATSLKKAEEKKVSKTKSKPKSATAKEKPTATKAKSVAAKSKAKKAPSASKAKPEKKTAKASTSKEDKKSSSKDNEISEQRIEIKATLKEQINIIDSFIQKEPSISSKPVKSIDSDQKDLSEKSTNFGDDLISENLAQILVEQGKSQKAIDMYKKLIWKFPQKKAYFAARIEDLTK